jgi:signal transduction histidine kinase/HAMP domain-containing protein
MTLQQNLRDYYSLPNAANLNTVCLTLDTLLKTIIDFEEISVVNPADCRVVASTDRKLINTVYYQNDVFKCQSQKTNVTTLLLDKTKTPKFYFYGPIYYNSKQYKTVIIKTNTHELNLVTNNYAGLGKTGETLIAQRSKSGDAVYITPLRFNNTAALILTVPKTETDMPITRALSKITGLMLHAHDYRQKEVIANTDYIPEADWGLVSKIDTSEINAKITGFVLKSIITFVFLVLIIIFTSFYITRKITEPIISLTHTAAQISTGDYTKRASTGSTDEIGALANMFNTMTDKLVSANKELEGKVNQRTQELTEEKQKLTRQQVGLIKINNCFLGFTTDFDKNIDTLTKLSGELLGADCALYNRLDNDLLCSISQWQTPADYNPQDKPDGHICYDVITKYHDEVFVVNNLQNTDYARTDPNVTKYNLHTYIGKAVKFNDKYIGSLCLVYARNFVPDENQKQILSILTTAVSIQETQKAAEKEKQLLNNRLIQAEKTASIGLLAGGVAHEINNPLTGILGTTQLLKRSVDKTGSLYTDLTTIESLTLRCANIVNSLLTFSRQDKLLVSKCSMDKIVSSALELMSYQLQSNNITVTINSLENLPEINVEEKMIEQVFLNLFNYATDTLQDGGTLTITGQVSGSTIEITFSDTGAGLPEDIIDKIFDPTITSKLPLHNSGFGLSISNKIIEKHKGTITVKNRQGQGTDFVITLPLNQI